MIRFLQIEPQPARGVLREEMWDSPDWWAEVKYDGDRRIAQFMDSDGPAVRFTGRRKSVKDGLFVEKTYNLPHLAGLGYPEGSGVSLHFPMPNLAGTVLDGEIVVPETFVTGTGGVSKHVTSIMGSSPDLAIAKQLERGWLEYRVFDCLYIQGQDVRGKTLFERRLLAESAVKHWGNPFVQMAQATTDKRGLLDLVASQRGEGIILKNVGHIYGDKKGWVKYKFTKTADVVIMRYKSATEMSKKKGDESPSMTKYAANGWIGAIIFGQYNSIGQLEECGSTSGIDEFTRALLSTRGAEFIGTPIRIKHFGREPTGKFRSPQFYEWLETKDARDCVMWEGES